MVRRPRANTAKPIRLRTLATVALIALGAANACLFPSVDGFKGESVDASSDRPASGDGGLPPPGDDASTSDATMGNDAPPVADGEVPTGPGVIRCGETESLACSPGPSSACCVAQGGAPATCQSETAGCSGTLLRCDNGGDCNFPDVCCFSAAGASCTLVCNSGTVLCNDDNDCEFNTHCTGSVLGKYKSCQ